jgi:hypothetical protein
LFLAYLSRIFVVRPEAYLLRLLPYLQTLDRLECLPRTTL